MEDAMHIVKSAEPAMSCVDPRADIAEIVVVRHGQTDWNFEHRIQGHSNVQLNEVGRQQTNAVANRLSKEGEISAIYSSDLKRAIETAEAIATACGVAQVIKEPDLREQNTGKLQGLSVSEAANVYPQIFKDFRSRRWDLEIPGGETKDQVYQRCTTCLQNIGLKHKGERVIVVTHGTVFRSIYRRACPKDGPAPKVQNGSVSILHFSGEDKWVMKSWSDHSHLNQTEDKL
ncbi:phosphoglycerate mutase-like protein 4 isoform X2 [Rhodamnia argentea]|uniref:Phosphoglycerate mutase-like protein 4 isoform X2 n=1 Tax=Rhodamnia argentea TaxID=178133 RepID=A0ABM3GVG6_9MYRT|nr:phosphoglycerate mutase-like protein 4 isoform X2 [Rhodamnia argentea]